MTHAEPDDSAAPVLSEDERRRVLSATRLKLTLTLFVVGILLGLSAMIFVGVSSIFDWLSPSIRHDLTQKAKRGVAELAQTAQLGIIVVDPEAIRAPAADYLSDSDVLSLTVRGKDGSPLFQHGDHGRPIDALFAQPQNVAHDLGNAYGAWAPSLIEGEEVGRVALLVSKARLEAGLQLRQRILMAAGLGCLLALALSLVFVNAYIGPILRVTGDAFVRLEQTTEAALAAAKLKSQFLANMSHEIRTPMNGIIGVLDLLHRTELNSKQQRYTEIIDASARGLLTIINDVLDFSKLEAGKYELSSAEFDVRRLVQEVGELHAPRAHGKQLELITRVDAAVPRALLGDVDRLKQVLNNLVGNATKFTEQGYVELTVTLTSAALDPHSAEQECVVRFDVRDTGLGIRKEDQARLFAEFSQVDGSLTRKYGGTGLGLAISKQLVHAMGGEVGVESELGRGSTFFFTIRTRAVTSTSPSEDLDPREARVLVVSPLEPQRAVVQALIESWGMRGTIATSTSEACALIQSGALGFDVVVIDGACDSTSEAGVALIDVCIGEGLPVIHLLASGEIARGSAADAERNYVLKPLRASELYNGLICVLDGGRSQQAAHVSKRPSRRAAASQQRARVLVVDDNEINRLVAVDLLTELDYPSDTACNGAEAVSKASVGDYGVILMDCQMPEVDGYEATRRIRALPAPRCRVPVIALTAHALTGDRELVLKAGMDDYATKPIRVRTLEQLLQRWAPDAGTQALSASRVLPANDNLGAPVDSPSATAIAAPEAPAALERLDLEALPEIDFTLPRSKLVLDLFLKSTPDLIASLEAAIQRESMPEVKQLAHKLKGNCLSLGASKLAAACHAIERAASAGRVHLEAHERLPALYANASRVLEQSRLEQRGSDLPKRVSQHG